MHRTFDYECFEGERLPVAIVVREVSIILIWFSLFCPPLPNYSGWAGATCLFAMLLLLSHVLLWRWPCELVVLWALFGCYVWTASFVFLNFCSGIGWSILWSWEWSEQPDHLLLSLLEVFWDNGVISFASSNQNQPFYHISPGTLHSGPSWRCVNLTLVIQIFVEYPNSL